MSRLCLGFFAVSVVTASLVACATSSVDDLDVDEANQTDPGATLPPPSVTTSTDAGGTTIDAGRTDTAKDAGKDAAKPDAAKVDGGTDAGPVGTPGPQCDLSDPLKAFGYQVQLAQQATPILCPCVATQCCFLGIACVDP